MHLHHRPLSLPWSYLPVVLVSSDLVRLVARSTGGKEFYSKINVWGHDLCTISDDTLYDYLTTKLFFLRIFILLFIYPSYICCSHLTSNLYLCYDLDVLMLLWYVFYGAGLTLY